MFQPGKRVVIRDSKGNDVDTGVVQEIVETMDEENPLKVRVKTAAGVSRVVPREQLVEHLED